jgi:predicted ferric reductase
MFAVCGAGLVALVFHTFLGRWTMPQHRYRVVEIRPLPGGVDDVHLEPVGPPMRFVPGQFGFLRFRHESIGAEAHPFSIASPPGDARVRFVVKELGDYTRRLLTEVHEGAEAVIEGPYGRFSHQAARGRDQVWIAGGIGIAPFLSMAASLPGSGFRAELYYCFPDDDQAPFLAELAQLDASVPELTVRMRCDRRDGLLTAGVIAGHGALGDREFLLCGPPVMMHSMRRQLRRAGVPSGRIHFEEFVFG